MVWGYFILDTVVNMKWDCCFHCEFIEGECSRSQNYDNVLDIDSLVKSSTHTKLACKSGSSVILLHEKHFRSCQIHSWKENCETCLLVALKQTS